MAEVNDGQLSEIVDDQLIDSDMYKSSEETDKFEFENPFNEIQLFSDHTDIVRLLTRIDSTRYCSAGDDGLVIVRNVETGVLLHVLRGHSRPVTCLCPTLHSLNGIPHWFLLTASSDRNVCIWDLEAGSLLKKFTDHNSTTKCIVPLLSTLGLFCFGGEKICLWSLNDGLLDMITADTEDDIQSVIVMKDNILVAAADIHIVVYKIISSENEHKLNFIKRFDRHRESIRCLVRVNHSCFASGSLDGAVLQWSVDSLTVTHEYNMIEDYEGLSRTYPHSIQHLLPLDERFLLCAHGCGIYVCDTKLSQQIFYQTDLHEGKLLHFDFICDGYLLVTSSEDSSIKLWRCFIEREPTKSPSQDKLSKKCLNTFSSCFKSISDDNHDSAKLSLELIGECQAHSAAVQMCLAIPPNRFLSCGVDQVVILWKNGIVETCKRDKMVRNTLFRLCSSEDDVAVEV